MGAIDTEALKAANDIVNVVGAYVSLRKKGSEYVGLCPFHSDKNPSFYVAPVKQICHCFSCGASHDVISFVQEIEGVDFKAACERLGAKPEWKPVTPIDQSAPPLPDRITSKPPSTAGRPKMATRDLGEPVRTWDYLDADGTLLGCVARYDTPEGKEIRCWTWGARGTASPSWGPGHWNKPRPLYGLDKLAARPSAPVLIVEGEKSADKAAELLPVYAVVCWPGGAGAWKHVDFGPLRGRQVLLWPDADRKVADAVQAKKYGIEEGALIPYESQPGPSAMLQLAAVLADPRGLNCRVSLLDVRDVEHDGFDAADWTGTGDELIAWAKPRKKEYALPNPAPQQVSPSSSSPRGVTEASPGDSGPAAAAGPDEPPPEATLTERPKRPPRQRPHLAAVNGNTALAPQPDGDPLPAALSDDALADAWMETYGADWRYVRQWGRWFEWDGDGWREDATDKAMSLAKQTTRQALYWQEAQSLTVDGKRKVNSVRTAANLLTFARSDDKCAARVDQWDTDPWLLGCPGGVIDLKQGKLLPADRESYITKRCAVAPASGTPQLWLDFLARITDGDQSLIDYLQRFAGYSLTGETSEHALAFLYGTGANGKSVFLNTLSGILGDYAASAGIETFTESKNERHSTEIARLRGARLVVTEETDSGGRWAEGKIKRLTGGGKISAHFMRQDDFEFTPQFKLLIAGNHKPMLRAVDEAIRRRFHLVPFKVTIPAEERDKQLADKLRDQWPQILNWMLEGCVSWQSASLGLPESIQAASDQYFDSEDVLGQWLEENCERAGRTESAKAYTNYSAWCDKQGERAWSRRAWANAMVDRGFDTSRTSGARYIDGIELKVQDTSSAPYWQQERG